MKKNKKITDLQKKLLQEEPSTELINEYMLEKFPELKKDYQKHPLKTKPTGSKPNRSDDDVLKDFFYRVLEENLTASNDYMDDEKQSIMEWARKQPLDRLFQIFSQHFYTNESIGNLFSGEWTADEVQAMNNTVTDCWQIAYLDSLPLADGIKMLVQLMMENIMAGEEEKEEEEKFSDPQASEKLLKVVSQTRSKDILRIVKKHEKKEPYQLLLRFCYNFPAKENDESKVAKISADLIHYSKPPRDNF